MKKGCSPAFKAQVALELLKEEKSLAQLSSEHGVHVSVLREWKVTALRGMAALFERRDNLAEQTAAHAKQVEELYAEIDRLTTQVNWLKKSRQPDRGTSFAAPSGRPFNVTPSSARRPIPTERRYLAARPIRSPDCAGALLGALRSQAPVRAVAAYQADRRAPSARQLPHEQPYRSPFLPTGSSYSTSPTDLEANPAAALFLTRVRAAQPAYRVGDTDLRQIAVICYRLDGLPLAIDLATALCSLLERQSSEQQWLAGSTMTLAAVTRFVGALAYYNAGYAALRRADWESARAVAAGDLVAGLNSVDEAMTMATGGEVQDHFVVCDHSREDEIWYVLEGQIRFTVGAQTYDAGPGSFAYIPRGIAHTFQVVSETARWFGIGIGGALDQWFFETGGPAGALARLRAV